MYLELFFSIETILIYWPKSSALLDVQQRILYQTSCRIFYQMSSSRKIATYKASFRRCEYLLDVQQQKNSFTSRLVEFLLDAQQNFYQTSSRPDDLGHYVTSILAKSNKRQLFVRHFLAIRFRILYFSKMPCHFAVLKELDTFLTKSYTCGHKCLCSIY